MGKTLNQLRAMTTRQLVIHYDCRLGTKADGTPGIHPTYNINADGKATCVKILTERRNEILAFLQERAAKEAAEKAAKEAEAAEMKRMVDAIPGLRDIQKMEAAARADMDKWYDEWERSEHGNYPCRAKPHYDFSAMYAQYPAAVAYLKAVAVACKDTSWNHFGDEAMECIARNPENYAAIIAKMEVSVSNAAMNWADSN